MKTKEQVLAHLKENGYKKSEISKIMGFLIGNGTKTTKELVYYRQGNRTFDDFLAWYQAEPEEPNSACPVCKMFNKLFEAMDYAAVNDDIETLSLLDELMDIMLDTFIEDTTVNDTDGK